MHILRHIRKFILQYLYTNYGIDNKIREHITPIAKTRFEKKKAYRVTYEVA